MTATQAPTPGPLSASDVAHVRDYWSAICDSDWHLIPADIRDDLEERLVSVGLAEWRAVTDDDLEDTFAYERGIEKGRSCLDLTALGHLAFKSDESGWMPWSGGENPVGDAVVEIKLRNGATSTETASGFPWSHDECTSYADIIAFRLAPTAPVEASGSERGHGPKCWGKTSISDEMMYCYCGSTDSPPGETREQVARIVADHISGGFDAALQDKQEWKDRSGLGYDCEPADVNGPFKDDYLSAADAILALIRPAPVASGGQHSEDTPCTDCGDTGVTHQTERRCSCQEAEAQDEGAAGKPVAWITKVALENWNKGDDAEAHVLLRKGGDMRVALYAHPSPPPAADEDRVRSALADLVSWFGKPVQGERGLVWVIRAGEQGADDAVNEALAALKSEGK